MPPRLDAAEREPKRLHPRRQRPPTRDEVDRDWSELQEWARKELDPEGLAGWVSKGAAEGASALVTCCYDDIVEEHEVGGYPSGFNPGIRVWARHVLRYHDPEPFHPSEPKPYHVHPERTMLPRRSEDAPSLWPARLDATMRYRTCDRCRVHVS